MKRFLLGLSMALLESSAFAQSKIQLSPQMVVDQVLERGLNVKKAEYTAQRSYLGLQTALGVYDFKLELSGGYNYDRAQTLQSKTTDLEKTYLFNASLSKSFITGTELTFSYDNNMINRRFNSFPTTPGSQLPRQSRDVVGVTVQQPLLRNMFGFADRLAVEMAQEVVRRASLEREEEIERVLLASMRLFWDAYVAQRQLSESTSARDKYETLVKNVRRKSGFNLSSPGELPRVEAEYNASQSQVKSASASYLKALDTLMAELRLPLTREEDVEFQVPEVLPDIPRLLGKPLESLRPYRIQKNKTDNAELGKRAAVNSAWPRLDVVGKAYTTGVEETRDRAVSEMVSGRYPTYYIGLEFETPLDSALSRGQVADARVALLQEQTEMMGLEDRLRNELRASERDIVVKYTLAQNAMDSVEKRSRVVRELETAYRQGRQPLVELIRAYNDLFTAQQDRARAVGNYHISLNELAAIRDELVNNSGQ